jgi:hypothetical protein
MATPPKTRRRWPWLLAAVVLLGLGAWVMTSAEPPPPPPPRPVTLPLRATHEERDRSEHRATWMPVLAVDDAGVPLAAPPKPRDPMLAMMPPEVRRGVVVAEVNAIRNSALGDLIVDCVFTGEDSALAQFRDAGVDPLSQVDRMAVVDDQLMMSGDFSHADVKALLGADRVTSYGRRGALYEEDLEDGRVEYSGSWNQQMIVTGGSREEVQAALDRLDGSGAPKPSVLSDDQAYGEVYGQLTAGAMADFIGEQDPRLADLIRQTAKNVQLHVDVQSDVGMVADVMPNDPARADELRRALGSALSLARLKERAQGHERQADLLNLTRVRGAGDDGSKGFRLETGLPRDFLEDSLKACARAKRETQARSHLDGGQK